MSMMTSLANTHSCRQRTHRRQQGVGLIEVLVAVLVLSIGFLGMAALQVKALSTNNGAMARSMVTVASYSILDAMRADRNSAINGNYNGTVTASTCQSAGGSLAGTQLNLWCDELGKRLGVTDSTKGTVNCVPMWNTANCTITVEFDDSRAGAEGDSTEQIVTKAML
jgi:type IV pilus assembly protein PilV